MKRFRNKLYFFIMNITRSERILFFLFYMFQECPIRERNRCLQLCLYVHQCCCLQICVSNLFYDVCNVHLILDIPLKNQFI